MNHHIKEFHLDERFKNYDSRDNGDSKPAVLKNLSKVNIFVGANNCGKSRFLRLLASTDNIRFVPALEDSNETEIFRALNGAKAGCENEFRATLRSNDIDQSYGDVFPRLEKLPSFDNFTEGQNHIVSVLELLERMQHFARETSKANQGQQFFPLRRTLESLSDIASRYKDSISRLAKLFPNNYQFTRLYIPMLRGLRSLPSNSGPTDLYAERTYTDYFYRANRGENQDKPIIVTGLMFYDEIRKQLLGTWAQRKNVRRFEVFLQYFFEGRQVELIPKHDGNVLDVRVAGERQRPISEWGDGVQSIIILTYPLFLRSGEQLLVFCEEPEQYMHPGLQRAFLSALTQSPEFAGFQFFLTTHSNHFLDLTLDYSNVSVYTFHKRLEEGQEEQDAKFIVENISNDNTRSLHLLGVQNSSVFLSNCTIWVEGITDRQYFRKYLELYQNSDKSLRKFKEDLHYSFVEYEGASITHWSFLDDKGPVVERLCGTLFLLVDGDNAAGAKAERFEKLKQKLGDRFHPLRSKEVENLLGPQVLLSVLEQYKETELNRNFTHDNYANAHLGEFIENVIIKKDAKKRNGSYIDGNTISDKLKFCSRATALTAAFTDLTLEAQEITQKIHAFIASKNPA